MYEFLKGLRVVEGAAFIAGPSCTLHLAQMGAEVIRFDAIGGGPDFRRWPLAPNGDSLYWEGLNKGKKSVALNLASAEGRALAVAIAAAPGPAAGLFVTNYPADGFLSYEQLRAARSDIICVRIMGWPDGAPAVDYTVNAAAGLPLMTGPMESQTPVNHVLPAWDLLAGAYAAFTLMAAERNRHLSGTGCEIRVPLSDLAAASLSHLGNLAEVLTTGADRPRFGNTLFGAFGRDFLTADQARIMVVAITARQWNGLLKALGIGPAVQALETKLGVSFAADEGVRFVHRDHLFPLFEQAFLAYPLATLAPRLEQHGVTWSRYQSIREAVQHDARLFSGNPIFQNILNPSGLTYPGAGPAATVSGAPRAGLAAAPRFGEHTDIVLRDVLGLADREIKRLHAAGIVAGSESPAV